MSEVCPFCGGTGKRIVRTEHRLTKTVQTGISLCICTKSRLVSESPYTKLLASLGDNYAPKIDSRLVFNFPDDLRTSPNLMIRGDFENFRLQVKSTVMNYRFRDPSPSIYCCHAIDLLKNFYVEQPDRSFPNLADTGDFDLLVFALGTKEKNEPLKTVVAQVIYTRLNSHKPTWVYKPEGHWDVSCPQDYSLDLENYLKDSFTEVILSGKSVVISTTESQKGARRFNRK